MTLPNAILPASVASSGTSRRGARPIRSKTAPGPRQKTSALSHGRATQKRASGCGSAATGGLGSTVRPATVARKFPRSTCAVPGARPGSRYPSLGPCACSPLQAATYLPVDEREPS